MACMSDFMKMVLMKISPFLQQLSLKHLVGNKKKVMSVIFSVLWYLFLYSSTLFPIIYNNFQALGVIKSSSVVCLVQKYK